MDRYGGDNARVLVCVLLGEACSYKNSLHAGDGKWIRSVVERIAIDLDENTLITKLHCYGAIE